MAVGRESCGRIKCKNSPDIPTALAPRARHFTISNGEWMPPEAMSSQDKS